MASPFLFQAFLNNMKGGSPSSPELYNTSQQYRAEQNTPLAPGGFKKAIDFLQNQTGKKITTAPAENMQGDSGYFTATLKDGGLYNSPSNANNRTIFLGPEASYGTLFHEAGHARDPGLRQGLAKEKQFNPQQIMSLPSAAERLDYFAQSQIFPRVNAEIEAQAYQGFQLPRFAAANPQLNINYQQEFNNPWYKEYPASYAQKGLDRFYAEETGANVGNINFPTDIAGPGVAVRVSRPNVALNTLNLALDKELQNKQQNILNQAVSNVEDRLNPYQTTPSTLRNYWAQ